MSMSSYGARQLELMLWMEDKADEAFHCNSDATSMKSAIQKAEEINCELEAGVVSIDKSKKWYTEKIAQLTSELEKIRPSLEKLETVVTKVWEKFEEVDTKVFELAKQFTVNEFDMVIHARGSNNTIERLEKVLAQLESELAELQPKE
ncbi:uncharacterized protein LOC116340183 [Contarinia nasturtii]|uniref:uncharacterized protein LOC116340183 n=1 Tax=Contarinia nasturtii TaxID=265458 RepID=UPI0012D43C94|nr:uncharacterized protein LOC116340183 [Contarinia nasturtii]